jgi:hypothetical protein
MNRRVASRRPLLPLLCGLFEHHRGPAPGPLHQLGPGRTLLARRQPILLLFEDAQWVDSASALSRQTRRLKRS